MVCDLLPREPQKEQRQEGRLPPLANPRQKAAKGLKATKQQSLTTEGSLTCKGKGTNGSDLSQARNDPGPIGLASLKSILEGFSAMHTSDLARQSGLPSQASTS